MGLPLVVGLAVVAAAGSALQSASAGGGAQARAQIAGLPRYVVAAWSADTDNLVPARGTVELGSAPVAGAHVRVDDFDVPTPTNSKGQFTYLVDHTLVGRHVVVVTDAANATVAGHPLTKTEQSDLLTAQGSIDVVYAVRDLKLSRNAAGDPVIAGKLANAVGAPPPHVGLVTYQLTGTVTGSDGKPVAGAEVSTRTQDRDYWTVSTPTDSSGKYSSLFTASSEDSSNPVPFTVRISIGDVVYQFLSNEVVYFKRLESAVLDIRLPPRGYAMAIPRPTSSPGAVYTGIVVGVAVGNKAVRPLSVTWPDSSGRFQITLPKSLAGREVSLWESKLTLFSGSPAAAGGAIDLREWPGAVPADAPAGLASMKLPG